MILKNRLGLGVLALAFTVASCDQPATEPAFDHTTAHASYAKVSAGELSGLAKTVRQVTSRFNSTTQATQVLRGRIIAADVPERESGLQRFQFGAGTQRASQPLLQAM